MNKPNTIRLLLTNSQKLKTKEGQILILAIVFLAVVLILSASLFGNIATFLRLGARSIAREQANSMAEAGVDYAIWQLNKNAGNFTPPATETKIGTSGSFITTITNQTSSLKTITSTGYVPNATNPQAKRTIKADVAVSSQTIAFHFAAQTGSGGLNMQNTSSINGTIYANGNITGSNSPVIYGDAYATGTISNPPSVTGTRYPNASPQPLPTIDYDYWKKAACNNDTGYPTSCQTAVTCPCNLSSSQHIGPKKYVGDLTLSNNALITLDGPIWVTGTFSMTQGSTTLKVNDNLGSNGTVIIVDPGKISLNQGGTIQPTNADPPGYVLLATTASTACSISGSGDGAIVLSQSSAIAVFYALTPNACALLQQSANVASLVANGLIMQNTAALTYSQGLASASFITGPGASWQIKKGTYRYTSSP